LKKSRSCTLKKIEQKNREGNETSDKSRQNIQVEKMRNPKLRRKISGGVTLRKTKEEDTTKGKTLQRKLAQKQGDRTQPRCEPNQC